MTEALSFSILIWTMWGFAEALYWQAGMQILDVQAPALSSWIYLVSFVLYLFFAAAAGTASYALTQVVLVALRRYEPYRFRAMTLSLILASFFLMVLNYHVRRYLWNSILAGPAQWMLIIGCILLAVATTLVLYRQSIQVGFRLRRPGATMFTILILSFLFSVLSFPLFTSPAQTPAAGKKLDLSGSANHIMAYHYLQSFHGE